MNDALRRKRDAFHEAGHVIFGLLAGKKLLSVDFDVQFDDGTLLARTRWQKSPGADNISEEEAFPEGLMIVAGYESQRRFAPETISEYDNFTDESDLELLARRIKPAGKNEFKHKCRNAISKLISNPEIGNTIEKLASLMIDGKASLSGDDITRQSEDLLKVINFTDLLRSLIG